MAIPFPIIVSKDIIELKEMSQVKSNIMLQKSPHKADFVSTLHKLDLKEGEEI